MASRVVGFLFTDNSFFNCEVSAQDVTTLINGSLGEWYAPQLASAKAAQYQLNVSSYLKEVKIGGFGEAAEVENLYQYAASESEPIETNDVDVNNKAPSAKWTYQLVLLLIDNYRKHKQLFENSCVKRAEAWKKVAKELQDYGYPWVTHELCDAKFRNLKFRYKKIMDASEASGKGRNRWEFFDVMHDLLEGDPACRPVSTLASLTGEESWQEGISRSTPSSSINLQPRTQSSTSSSFSTQPSTSSEFSTQPSTSSRSPRASTSHSHTSSRSPRASTSHSHTSSHSPRASTSSHNSKSLKKRKRSDEPPVWFKDFVAEQNKKCDEMKKLYEERNELFKNILDRLVPKNIIFFFFFQL